jgi:hypothetical protein
LEAQDDPITLGQGLFHASTTAAGLMMTSDLRDMFHGDDGPSPTVYRIYTLAGALGGAAVGRQGRDKFIEPTDVGEVLFTTMMSRFAALNLAATMGINSIEAEAGVAIAGSLAGGALGRHVAGRWNVSEADPLLGALGFMEGMAVGQVVNDNLMDRVENGWFEGNFAFAGLAGGLVYSHFEKPTVNEAVGIGFATGMGHILGYGLNDLAGIDDYGTSGLVSTGAGVASMIAATQFETSTAESYGRWVPVAADMALATYNAGMVVGWLHAKDMFAPASTLDSGIMFSTIALSGLQAQFNTPWSGPSTGRSLLLLSANAWGSYYATMGMIAGGEPLMDSLGENAILVPLVVGDAAMGYAMWASGAGGLFTPRDTAVVQMGGVAGVTLGALTVLMLVDDVQAMAVGSMVGGVVGAYAGLKLTDRFLPVLDQVTASIDLPDLPGVWAPTLSPTIMEDGSLGGHIGITAFGW